MFHLIRSRRATEIIVTLLIYVALFIILDARMLISIVISIPKMQPAAIIIIKYINFIFGPLCAHKCSLPWTIYVFLTMELCVAKCMLFIKYCSR